MREPELSIPRPHEVVAEMNVAVDRVYEAHAGVRQRIQRFSLKKDDYKALMSEILRFGDRFDDLVGLLCDLRLVSDEPTGESDE